MRGKFFSGSILFVWLACLGAAEMPYFVDFKAALASAKETGKKVILYTGSKEKCPSNSPSAFFFEAILGKYMPLGERSNQYVVCEQFIYAPSHDAADKISPLFFAEVHRVDPLYTRYNVKVFWPSVTFVDNTGALLSGPYQYDYDDLMTSRESEEGYETLAEYALANPPLQKEQALSNLMAAIMRTNTTGPALQVYQVKWHREGNQPEILLDSGFPSKLYELVKELHFTVRDCGIEKTKYPGEPSYYAVSATGHLREGESFPKTETVLVRLNGAYFRFSMASNGSGEHAYGKSGAVSLLPEEDYVHIILREKKPAVDMLLREFQRLRDQNAK